MPLAHGATYKDPGVSAAQIGKAKNLVSATSPLHAASLFLRDHFVNKTGLI